MPEQLDLDLRHQRTPVDTLEPSPPRRLGPAILAGILILAVAAGGYVLYVRRSAVPAKAPAAAPVRVADERVGPLGTGDPIPLPPLDETDSLVRELVQNVSSHPGVIAWLATPGLIRNFAVVVLNIADGRTPSAHLAAVRPPGGLNVVTQQGNLFIDSRSYARYDLLADAVASVDAAGAARLYGTLKPRIEDAYRDLGFPGGSFDAPLERAIVLLLATPVPDRPIEVEPRGIVYAYADPRFESLSGAQKHLLRMGPRNARLIQGKLREIALALGIPDQRLPSPK
jgi:Protein of unknown function (DUF3014)